MNERFSNNDHSNTDSESRSENLEREYVNNQSTQELDRSFLPNLVRMSLLLALIKVCQIILLKGSEYPIPESIFRRASFFGVADIVGVIVGGAIYFLFGMRISFMISVVMCLSSILGMMYLMDRNDELNHKSNLTFKLQQIKTI